MDQIQFVDRRILDLDMEQQEVLTSDQQRLQVDAYARFRIIQPKDMIENAGTEENVRLQLAPILTSVLRQELGRRTFASLLTAERGTAMQRIRDTLDTQARQYGAQVIDVQIKRADLPEGTPLTAAFTRMQSDRQEEAETIRAQGRKNAQIIRAEAEAAAASTYADAYGKDPEFYDFYRAMESYRRPLNKAQAKAPWFWIRIASISASSAVVDECGRGSPCCPDRRTVDAHLPITSVVQIRLSAAKRINAA